MHLTLRGMAAAQTPLRPSVKGPVPSLYQLASSLPGKGAHLDREALVCVLSVIA